MKTILKTALTATARTLAYWRMRSIEINLAGAIDSLPYVKDQDTLASMHLSIKVMSKELCRARAHYQSFLKPGKRLTWSVA